MDGSDFERDVRDLLRMQGWRITDETLLLHKRVDAIGAKEDDFGETQHVAIECKAHAAKLSKRELINIFADYRPLLTAGRVDRILLVTLNGLSPSGLEFVRNERGLTHVTYVELQSRLMDFRAHVSGMIQQARADGLSDYYVGQRYDTDTPALAGQNDALTAVMHWVKADDGVPIALLGSYGMGKTSLTRMAAFRLGLAHQADVSQRIPILIRLDQLATEQDLAGLLGKQFTHTSPVPRYSLSMFLELNRLGRFVVLLDGFDEMKQTMSWEVMEYNLSQLNQLVDGRSRVLLGGRPNAFLNQDEHMLALHGKIRGRAGYQALPGWPDYGELRLLPFGESEITSFVLKYAATSAAIGPAGPKVVGHSPFDRALASEHRARFVELAQRPVQLRMLIDVLPEWGGAVEELDLQGLYSRFIDLIIHREMAKHSRRRFGVGERRRFARDLAWWMWLNGSVVSLRVAEVPETIWNRFALPGESLDAVRRDLVSACFLERKGMDSLYFPHRSFLEFLVAEELSEVIASGDLEVTRGFRMNPEVREFFLGRHGAKSEEVVRDAAVAWLSKRNRAPYWICDLLVSLSDGRAFSVRHRNGPPSPFLHIVWAVGLAERRWPLSPGERWEQVRELIVAHPQAPSRTDPRWAKLYVVITALLWKDFANNMDSHKLNEHLVRLAKAAGSMSWWKANAYSDQAAPALAVGHVVRHHFDGEFLGLESVEVFKDLEAMSVEVFWKRRSGGRRIIDLDSPDADHGPL